MRKFVWCLMLMITFAAGCATPHQYGGVPMSKEEAALALQQAKETREREHREQLGYDSITASPNQGQPTAGDVLKAIVALPVAVGLGAVANYGRYHRYPSVHCRSWTYKDAYHTSCY